MELTEKPDSINLYKSLKYLVIKKTTARAIGTKQIPAMMSVFFQVNFNILKEYILLKNYFLPYLPPSYFPYLYNDSIIIKSIIKDYILIDYEIIVYCQVISRNKKREEGTDCNGTGYTAYSLSSARKEISSSNILFPRHLKIHFSRETTRSFILLDLDSFK